MPTLEETLAERGSRYGDFTNHARIAQALQGVMRSAANPFGSDIDSREWNRLSDVQKQALTVMADKIARILNGDPNYVDNWHDIAGYAKLVEDRLLKSPTRAKLEEASHAELMRGILDAKKAFDRSGKSVDPSFDVPHAWRPVDYENPKGDGYALHPDQASYHNMFREGYAGGAQDEPRDVPRPPFTPRA